MSRVAIRPFKSVLALQATLRYRHQQGAPKFASPRVLSKIIANALVFFACRHGRQKSALTESFATVYPPMSGDMWDDELPSEADLARFDAAVDERSSVTAAAVQLGITQLHDWQRRVVDAWLAGRDALVLSGTGSGKSACYMLPAVISRANGCRGVALVITPLISLARDQVLRLTN